MAYTYQEFLNAANSSGVMDKFSQQDLTVAQKNPEYGLSMVSLMKDVSGATTAEQRLLATEAANQLRKNYGVSGGGGGSNGYKISGVPGTQSSQYPSGGKYQGQIQQLLGQIGNYGSFQYGNQGQIDQTMDRINNYGPFQYGNQGQIDQTMDKINHYGPYQYGNETLYQQMLNNVANPEAFSYDYTKDPSFSAYKKAYLREGDRAAANALAQASAASGGQVSSYAAQAAQQANNYYAGQVADMIPTLEQNAYQRYLNDLANQMNGLSAMQSDRNFDYQKYLNDFANLNTVLQNLNADRNFQYQNHQDGFANLNTVLQNLNAERNFAYDGWLNEYNMLLNNLNAVQSQDATDYQRYLDQESLRLQQEETAYNRRLQEEQLAYDRALDQYKILGYITPEMSTVLGIPATVLEEPVAQVPYVEPTDPLDDPNDADDTDADLSWLLGMYPGGVISDAVVWDNLVGTYGAEALAAAGLYLKQEKSKANGGGGKPGMTMSSLTM